MITQELRWRDLELRPSKIQAKGVFAKRLLPAGALITTVEGVPHEGAYDDEFAAGPTWFGVAHHHWIEPSEDSPPRFLNHSCEPNAVVEGGVRVLTARDIRPGEEVTIDYATTEEDPHWQMHCRCRSPKCRGIIRASAVFPR